MKITAKTRKAIITRVENMLVMLDADYQFTVDNVTYTSFTNRVEPSRGAIKAHIAPHLQDLEPGQAARVPFGEFSDRQIKQNTANYAIKEWGAGNYMLTTDLDGAFVEIARIG